MNAMHIFGGVAQDSRVNKYVFPLSSESPTKMFPSMNEFRSFQMSAVLALLALLALGAALADHGPGGHGHPPSPVGAGAAGAAGPVPQVKYGGPIVYSGEKPPIIHFPPPPPPVSFAVEARQILRSFPPQDDLNQPLPDRQVR